MTEPSEFHIEGSTTLDVPSARITGQVWLDHLGTGEPPSRIRLVKAHFAPGARTVWHRHQYGQILHVTEGVALTQERGKPVGRFRAGETIVCPPGVWHWHGSAPDQFMTHIAVHEVQDDGEDAQWGEQVLDEEYLAAES